MNFFDAISLVSALVSIILAILAMWLSWEFYKESSNAQKGMELGVESIKTQTKMLESLTAKWMDRFTRHATAPKQADETTLLLIDMYKTSFQPTLSTQLQSEGEISPQIVRSYIALLYYCATTNVSLQAYLPADIGALATDQSIKNLVDSSFADYNAVVEILNGISDDLLRQSPLYSLYEHTISEWSHSIKDTTTVYSERSNVFDSE